MIVLIGPGLGLIVIFCCIPVVLIWKTLLLLETNIGFVPLLLMIDLKLQTLNLSFIKSKLKGRVSFMSVLLLFMTKEMTRRVIRRDMDGKRQNL